MENQNTNPEQTHDQSTTDQKIIDSTNGQNAESDEQIFIPVSKLKLLPIDKRMRLIGLVESNIGKKAKITLDHTNPQTLITDLHPEHVRMLKVGWLQDVEIVAELK